MLLDKDVFGQINPCLKIMEIKTIAGATFIIWVETVPFEVMSTKVLNELEVLSKMSHSFIEKAEFIEEASREGRVAQ